MAELRFERLGRKFGDFEAVKEFSLHVGADDFLVLLGPSGCGKTTVLRMLAGLLPASSGRILLDGRDITSEPPKRRDLAMVFQSYALYPHMTVARNIGFPLKLRGVPKSEIDRQVRDAAEMLQLSELLGRRPKELSGGQRQRVALGRAVVRRPKAFLMDEPLSNLDAKLRNATRMELTELHRRLGTTFVYVTHDQVEAMTMATRIAIMNAGVLEQVGSPTEVYDRPSTTFVAGFIGSPPMNLLAGSLGSEDGLLVVSATGLRVPLWRGSEVPRNVVVGIRPEDLHPTSAAILDLDAPRLNAVVTAVENLGSEEVAVCSMGLQPVLVRGARPLGLTPGSHLTLTCRADRVHLFDAASGRRLVWAAADQEDALAVSAAVGS